MKRTDFSIVIPTYNEEREISGTLDAMLRIDYPEKEIIVVDDSTDQTPEIVRGYADKGVRLIHPGGGGRCEARNKGIVAASGEVVCIINADVRPRRCFLNNLSKHYESGADYVLIRSRVSNRDGVFARYLASLEERDFRNTDWMEWTEGFSCRRALALKAGLFPVGFSTPICAGEDGFFGTNLRKLTTRKVIDLSIEVDHVVPDSFGEYWSARLGRGIGSTQIHRFIEGWTFQRIFAWNALKTAIGFGAIVLLVPALAAGIRLAAFSDQGMRDFPGFAVAWAIERAAFSIGEWKGLADILRSP